uniref:Uncharacterized protein n=1 Tax=Cercocebus atys TaxID=9531 RepID=A0A2K5NCI0_CERAT
MDQFEICSLVKSLTLVEGWPHILMFGHPLTFVASQMSYHLASDKRLCPPGQVGDTRGSTTKSSLPVVQLVLLPYPILSSQIHRGLFRW